MLPCITRMKRKIVGSLNSHPTAATTKFRARFLSRSLVVVSSSASVSRRSMMKPMSASVDTTEEVTSTSSYVKQSNVTTTKEVYKYSSKTEVG